MTFQDLPADWPTRPVTDPAITADLLDLIVSDRDRATGAIGVLTCGPTRRLVQPVVVTLPPDGAEPSDRALVFDAVCGGITKAGGGGGVLVAVARSGAPFVTADDRAWHDAAQASCAAASVELLGTWLVTPSVIRPVFADASQEESA